MGENEAGNKYLKLNICFPHSAMWLGYESAYKVLKDINKGKEGLPQPLGADRVVAMLAMHSICNL